MQESPNLNRFSAVLVNWVVPLFGMAPFYSWPVALMSATTLVDARTSSLRAAVRSEQCERQGESFWDSAVVAPAKELVGALEVLNENFARGLILQVLWSSMYIVSLICMLLSKWFAALDDEARPIVTTIVPLGLIYNLVPATQCLVMLSAIGTSCDDFIEDLNNLRGATLSEIERVSRPRFEVLEQYLKNVNHGQGIGFKIGGLVLTKKILFIAFAEMVGGLAILMPIILNNSVLADEDSRGRLPITLSNRAIATQ